MKRPAAVAAVLLALAMAVSAWALTRPDPATQAVRDGCGRDDTAAISNLVPEWAYVGDANAPADGPPPPPQWLKGVVSAIGNGAELAVHTAGGDIPTTHRSYDLNVDVLPDPAYQALMGGDPVARTGNFAAGGDEAARMHTELESRAIPTYAWPEPGDRVEMLGSWVWDCGHWLPGGERTEIHPIRALWLLRNRGGRPSPLSAAGEAEGDLLLTSDKTGAGKVADCAHRTKGDRNALKACIATEPDWQDVAGSYRFFLQAPPRPSPGARLRVRVVDAGSTPGAPPVRLAPNARGVSVSLDVPPTLTAGRRRLVVAKRVLAGWTPTPARSRPLHLRVRFTRFLARRTMDPACPRDRPQCPDAAESTNLGQISTRPGEWNVYSDVAGVWSLWRPTTLLVRRDGQSFRVDHSFDVYLQRGRPWRVLVWTRECDYGSFGGEGTQQPLWPCPKNGEFGVRAGDDVPGMAVVEFRSPAAGLGTHSLDSWLDPSTCPRSNTHGCFRVTFSVTMAKTPRRP
ncbi:MAG TPA: hypothetical protein VF101_10470 [Gaiellaceae bacterium]